jgi:hypothetical protein
MPHLPGKPERLTPWLICLVANVCGSGTGYGIERQLFRVGTHAFLRIASAFAQGSPVLGSLKINSLFMKVNCFCACSAASASLFNSTLRVPAFVLVPFRTPTTLAA